jgi:trimeric autotransporter adhesin
VPLLGSANTFTGNQTVNGTLSATQYWIGSNLFAFGSYLTNNAFLGFAGNTTMTGAENTATGYGALVSSTTGGENTASGYEALSKNTTGSANTTSGAVSLFQNTTGRFNTASGYEALYGNTTGSDNTAIGDAALAGNTTGSFNTALGRLAGQALGGAVQSSYDTFVGAGSAASVSTAGTPITNATAIGANAVVAESNAVVLGAISGTNNGTSVNVGIGTTTPAYNLDVHGTANFTGAVTFASNQTVTGNQTVVSNQIINGNQTVLGNQVIDGLLVATGPVSATLANIQSLSGASVSVTGAALNGNTVSGSNTSTSGSSNGAYFSTASQAGTAVVGVNTAGGYGGIFQGNVNVTGEHSTGTLSIGGDAPMSHNPHMVFSGFLAGNLGSNPYGGLFIPDQNILVTRISAYATQAGSNCSVQSQAGFDTFGSGPSYFINLPPANVVDSGPINVPVPAGTNLIISGIAASGCSLEGTSASNVFVNVQYVMQ